MGPNDGLGALEARLTEVRQKKEEQLRLAASAAALEAVARKADAAAHAKESADLVQEFMARARRLGIHPKYRIPGAVEVTMSVNAGGGGYLHSERYLDRTMTKCWHLGGKLAVGGSSKAYPGGTSFHYFLSEAGLNLIPEVREGSKTFAFFKAEHRIKKTVTWLSRTPDIRDVVKTTGGVWDEPREEVTLIDAMVAFFEDHEQA